MSVNFFSLALAATLAFALAGCAFDNTSSVEKNTLTFDTIPHMELYNLGGKKFKTTELQPGKPVVFFFFSPNCPLCKQSTEQMLHEIDKLKEVRLYFVSPDQPEEVMEYSTKYNLKEYPDVNLLLDPNHEFDNKYLPTVTPIYYVYGSDLLYRGTLVGKKSADEITKLANKKK